MAAPHSLHRNPNPTPAAPEHSAARPYDFSRPDRIPAHQLRLLDPVHRAFARSFALNVSAYLRTLVEVSVLETEQLSYAEFSKKMLPPLTLVPLRLHPYAGAAILQLSHQAAFPIIEMLLGGAGSAAQNINREMTEIERCVFEPVLRMLVEELRSSWKPIAAIEFGTQDQASALPLLSTIPGAEPFLVIGFELRTGELAGAINLGLPSRFLPPLVAESQPCISPQAEDCARMLRLLDPANVTADVRLNGAKVPFGDLMNLEPGDVLAFDYPVAKELDLELNGAPKFKGHVVALGENRGFQLKRLWGED